MKLTTETKTDSKGNQVYAVAQQVENSQMWNVWIELGTASEWHDRISGDQTKAQQHIEDLLQEWLETE